MGTSRPWQAVSGGRGNRAVDETTRQAGRTDAPPNWSQPENLLSILQYRV